MSPPHCHHFSGPMGVGKGHVLSWLSTQGLFPLEFVAHIDPDFFKRIMPEWETYIAAGWETAGTLCHLGEPGGEGVLARVARFELNRIKSN